MGVQNLELIKQSFPLVFQRKSDIAALFYAELFRRAPETQAMFRKDFSTQQEMLATVLTTLAKASFDPEKVQDILARLARAHAGLGLTEAQFRAGEGALCLAVGQVVGDKVPPATLEAWTVAIRRVIAAMLDPPEA